MNPCTLTRRHGPLPVHIGSAWIVMPYPAPNRWGTPSQVWGLKYYTSPDDTFTGRMTGLGELPPGTVIIAGQTHMDTDRRLTPDTSQDPAEFVEVILPFRCYVSRVHFDTTGTSLSPID